MKKIIIVAVLIILTGGAFYLIKKTPLEIADAPDTDYKSITYQVNGWPVKLLNGFSETQAAPGSASKITTKYFGNEARADLNGDGLEDIAFLLTQDTGGSGIFYYVVAALKTSTGYRGTNAILLGDRIAPQTTEFVNGKIIVNFADRKKGEPMTTQPSVGISKYLKVEGTILVEVAR